MSEFPNRAALRGPRHCVAADHPLAALAGIRVLDAGGTAADAAVATAAAMVVVQPRSSHLGGDLFALHYDCDHGRVLAMNASGPAPRSTDVAALRRAGTIPGSGAGSVTIPGCVGGWWELHNQYGRLPWSRLFDDAIRLATDGFPASRSLAGMVSFGRKGVVSKGYFETTYGHVAGDGGQLIRQPETAATLAIIAEHGDEGFYSGPVAESCRSTLAAGGVEVSAEEWQSPANWVRPLTVPFAGYNVHTQPPPSLGIRLALALQEYGREIDRTAVSPGDVPWAAQVRAMRSAFTTAAESAGDPEQSGFDARALLDSREHGADTTYLMVIDEEGSAVSLIQSVFSAWGSGLWDEATGVLFNNRMAGFSLEAGHPNEVAPGQRPMHTLNCYLVTEPGAGPDQLRMVGGTPGADWQPQVNLQILDAVLRRKMELQDALDAPRWSTLTQTGARFDRLACERRDDDSLALALRAGGFEVVDEPPRWGRAGVVYAAWRDADGVAAAADLRGEGLAIVG